MCGPLYQESVFYILGYEILVAAALLVRRRQGWRGEDCAAPVCPADCHGRGAFVNIAVGSEALWLLDAEVGGERSGLV